MPQQFGIVPKLMAVFFALNSGFSTRITLYLQLAMEDELNGCLFKISKSSAVIFL
jgi:hypothetical protein